MARNTAIVMTTATIGALILLVGLLLNDVNAIAVALAGLGAGACLAVNVTAVGAWLVMRRVARRQQARWQESVKTRHGGALWTRGQLPQVPELAGWKVARIVGEQTPHFVGLAFGRYGPNEVASCVHHDHEAPQPDCTCGFYAFRMPWRARWAWTRSRDGALLHVEGFGLAIEHEVGWRARRQEIMTVYLARRCRHCWRRTQGLSRVPLFNEWTTSCHRCASQLGREMRSVADLANEWGTEVQVARQFRWGLRAPR